MRFNQYGQMIGEDLANWTACPWPEKKIIQGNYCCLEPINPEKHGTGLYAAHCAAEDAGRWTYLLQEKPQSLDEMLAMLEEFKAADDTVHFAVVSNTSRQALGSLALMSIDPASGVIEIGHVNFSPLLQHTVMATEAVYLLLEYVFSELGYRRCQWKCDNYNEPSKRAAMRFGFDFEGVLNQAVITKARSRDTAMFAIMDKQWPRLQTGFKFWLHESNFDPNGQQKSKLSFERFG